MTNLNDCDQILSDTCSLVYYNMALIIFESMSAVIYYYLDIKSILISLQIAFSWNIIHFINKPSKSLTNPRDPSQLTNPREPAQLTNPRDQVSRINCDSQLFTTHLVAFNNALQKSFQSVVSPVCCWLCQLGTLLGPPSIVARPWAPLLRNQ